MRVEECNNMQLLPEQGRETSRQANVQAMYERKIRPKARVDNIIVKNNNNNSPPRLAGKQAH